MGRSFRKAAVPVAQTLTSGSPPAGFLALSPPNLRWRLFYPRRGQSGTLRCTAYVIFIVVIGGIGTMEGPVIGAIVFYLMQRYLADFGASYLILLGALGILVMLFAPKGLWGLVSERYDLRLFPTRRRLVVSARDDERRA
jgi:hypothetical protein